MESFVRFLIGGIVVSAFASLADVLRPKGFAGLFAAAPSVALASLVLAALSHGSGYASTEARSMIAGEVALALYAVGCVWLLAVRHVKAATASISFLALWGLVAGGLYWGLLQQ